MAADTKASRALTSPGYIVPFFTVAILYLIFGFITTLNMALVPDLRSIFSLPYAWAMLAESAFFLAYFVFSMPSAKLIEWIGYKRTMVVSLFVQVVGCLLFIPAARMVNFPLFLTAVFVVGAGVTAIQTAANPYVTILGPEDSAPVRLTLAQAFNSVGTTLAPLAAGAFILSDPDKAASKAAIASMVQGPYLAIAAGLLLLALAVMFSHLPAVPQFRPENDRELGRRASASGYLTPWKKFADFNGRSDLGEYWAFQIVNALVYGVLYGTGVVLKFEDEVSFGAVFIYASLLFALAVLIPSLAVGVRRLHDTGKGGWWLLVGLFPLIGTLILVVFMLKEGDPSSNRYGTAPEVPSRSALGYRHTLLGALGIFFYVGTEVGLASIAVNYFKQEGMSSLSTASFLVSLYWGGSLVGRLAGSWILTMVKSGKLLGIVGVGGAALLLLSMMSSGGVAIWSLVLCGLCNSIMFPNIFALAVAGLGSMTSKGSGLITTAIVGGAVMPWLLGAAADRVGIQHAFVIPMACYLYIAYYGVSGSKQRSSA